MPERNNLWCKRAQNLCAQCVLTAAARVVEFNDTRVWTEFMALPKMVLVAGKVAGDDGVDERGYRVLLNCNREAGQAVFHIHLHVLGGRPMGWPPG